MQSCYDILRSANQIQKLKALLGHLPREPLLEAYKEYRLFLQLQSHSEVTIEKQHTFTLSQESMPGSSSGSGIREVYV